MPNDLSALSNRLEASQKRLSSTMEALRVEAKPKAVLAKKMKACRDKANEFAHKDDGSLNIPVVAAALAAVVALVGVLSLFGKKR